MALNKFFTIMVVPEKSSRVTKVVLPSYIFKGAILAVAFLGILATIMVLDYANVMNQINENKQLKTENRQLRQNVQVFKNKIVTIENTLQRVKTFETKLRIITNIEDTPPMPMAPLASPLGPGSSPIPGAGVPGVLPQSMMPDNLAPLPNEKPAQPKKRGAKTSANNAEPIKTAEGGAEPVIGADGDLIIGAGDGMPEPPIGAERKAPEGPEEQRVKRLGLLAALMDTESSEAFTMTDQDSSAFVKAEFEKLDAAYEEVNKFALEAERETQDILEKLAEKRVMLATTPMKIPTMGYITSDYDVRISPYDGRRKMHEGIDIANRLGSDIIAPADGTVTFANTKPGYGKVVIIDHGNGIETLYAHSLRLLVNPGDRVRRGQKIAAVGNSGHSTGPHCHYEVHVKGMAVDPCRYILDRPDLCRRR